MKVKIHKIFVVVTETQRWRYLIEKLVTQKSIGKYIKETFIFMIRNSIHYVIVSVTGQIRLSG